MTTPKLSHYTIAPLTGHNTTWRLEFKGRPFEVKLDRSTRPVWITALDTGRDFKPTSKQGAAILALVVDAYTARFGNDPIQYHTQEN